MQPLIFALKLLGKRVFELFSIDTIAPVKQIEVKEIETKEVKEKEIKMKPYDDTNIPSEFYSSWNLPSHIQESLTEYALLRTTRQELQVNVYKTLEFEEELKTYYPRFHILYKGKLFPITWQHEAFKYYINPRNVFHNPEFIVSLRELNGEKLALVQRLRKPIREA